MKVADLTVDELQALIRKVVHEELQAVIGDPDKGLEGRTRPRRTWNPTVEFTVSMNTKWESGWAEEVAYG